MGSRIFDSFLVKTRPEHTSSPEGAKSLYLRGCTECGGSPLKGEIQTAFQNGISPQDPGEGNRQVTTILFSEKSTKVGRVGEGTSGKKGR